MKLQHLFMTAAMTLIIVGQVMAAEAPPQTDATDNDRPAAKKTDSNTDENKKGKDEDKDKDRDHYNRKHSRRHKSSARQKTMKAEDKAREKAVEAQVAREQASASAITPAARQQAVELIAKNSLVKNGYLGEFKVLKDDWKYVQPTKLDGHLAGVWSVSVTFDLKDLHKKTSVTREIVLSGDQVIDAREEAAERAQRAQKKLAH